MGAISLWVFYVHTVSRRLETKAYKYIYTMIKAKKYFAKIDSASS